MKGKAIISPYLTDQTAVKEAAVGSLRNSFEMEGIRFTDDKVRLLVEKARTPSKTPHK